MSHWWSRKKKCEQCGEEFESNYYSQVKYCSNACRQKAYRERKKKRYGSDPKRNGESVTGSSTEV